MSKQATERSMKLRDYQQALVQRIGDAWAEHPRVMTQLPTGGGKTVIFSHIAEQFLRAGQGVLVLAHRQELISQAAAKLSAIAPYPVGIVKAGVTPDYGALVQVGSVQSVVRRLDKMPEPGLIIIDEAHHSTAQTYRKILEYWPDALQLGVTATPCRTDGTGFRDLFDALVTGPTVAQLIKAGHLCDFRLYADPTPMKTKGARTRQGDFSSADVAKLNDAIELSGNLVASYRHHCPGKSCIVFAINVEHSKTIVARYNEAGIPAAHLDGTSSPQHRADTLTDFAQGKLLILSNVGLFTEGFDLPSLDAVQVARPTKSLALWLQMVGRALRPAPEKDGAILLDHTLNYAIHGLPTRPRLWTLDQVKDVDPEQTKKKRKARELEESVEVEIVEGDKELQLILDNLDDEWTRYWTDLVRTQQQRGYRKGWIVYQLCDIKPPIEVWKLCGAYMGFKPGWAWHQWQAQNAGAELATA